MMLTNLWSPVGPRIDYATKGVPGRRTCLSPRVIYYPHYAHTGDRTHVSQAFIENSDARVNVGLS